MTEEIHHESLLDVASVTVSADRHLVGRQRASPAAVLVSVLVAACARLGARLAIDRPPWWWRRSSSTVSDNNSSGQSVRVTTAAAAANRETGNDRANDGRHRTISASPSASSEPLLRHEQIGARPAGEQQKAPIWSVGRKRTTTMG